MLAPVLWRRMPALNRSVIVNLKTNDTAIRGVLWKARGAWLVVRQSQALREDAAPVGIDGDVLIHRENVDFIQVLP